MDHDPLLLLDNGTLAYILGDGDYRFANIKFEICQLLRQPGSKVTLKIGTPSVITGVK